jgi:hypothetical protein
MKRTWETRRTSSGKCARQYLQVFTRPEPKIETQKGPVVNEAKRTFAGARVVT